jgi:hypothetical protein
LTEERMDAERRDETTRRWTTATEGPRLRLWGSSASAPAPCRASGSAQQMDDLDLPDMHSSFLVPTLAHSPLTGCLDPTCSPTPNLLSLPVAAPASLPPLPAVPLS